MNRECKLCHSTRSLFKLDLKDDENEPYEVLICGNCWDSIAEIARRVFSFDLAKMDLNNRLEALERRVQEQESAIARLTGTSRAVIIHGEVHAGGGGGNFILEPPKKEGDE